MTQDEILQTLRKVIAESDNFTTWTVSTPHLVELVKRAIAAEREACAKVCDVEEETANEETWYQCAKELAKQIRARGKNLNMPYGPPRTWVGLTDEECMDAYDLFMGNIERARAIEAKLREKNT